MWELDNLFPEVLGEWRGKSLRTVLTGRPWRREESILLLEARALCTAVQIECSHAGAKGGCLLCLVGNMAQILDGVVPGTSSCCVSWESLQVWRLPSAFRWVCDGFPANTIHVTIPQGVGKNLHNIHLTWAHRSSHQVQYVLLTPISVLLHPCRLSVAPWAQKAKNDENIVWSSRGGCGSLAACCAKSSSSNSTAGEQAHQKARTELDASVEQEWWSWIDPVARSGEGGGNSGRAAKGHEERFIPPEAAQRPQVQMRQKCRNSRAMPRPPDREDESNTKISRLVRVLWNFARCNPRQQGTPRRVCRSSWSGATSQKDDS